MRIVLVAWLAARPDMNGKHTSEGIGAALLAVHPCRR